MNDQEYKSIYFIRKKKQKNKNKKESYLFSKCSMTYFISRICACF